MLSAGLRDSALASRRSRACGLNARRSSAAHHSDLEVNNHWRSSLQKSAGSFQDLFAASSRRIFLWLQFGGGGGGGSGGGAQRWRCAATRARAWRRCPLRRRPQSIAMAGLAERMERRRVKRRFREVGQALGERRGGWEHEPRLKCCFTFAIFICPFRIQLTRLLTIVGSPRMWPRPVRAAICNRRQNVCRQESSGYSQSQEKTSRVEMATLQGGNSREWQGLCRRTEGCVLHVEHDGECKTDVAMEEEDYEVEAILDERVRSRKRQFLIKWMGWPEEDSTWEPLAALSDCPNIIAAWQAKGEVALPPAKAAKAPGGRGGGGKNSE